MRQRPNTSSSSCRLPFMTSPRSSSHRRLRRYSQARASTYRATSRPLHGVLGRILSEAPRVLAMIHRAFVDAGRRAPLSGLHAGLLRWASEPVTRCFRCHSITSRLGGNSHLTPNGASLCKHSLLEVPARAAHRCAALSRPLHQELVLGNSTNTASAVHHKSNCPNDYGHEHKHKQRQMHTSRQTKRKEWTERKTKINKRERKKTERKRDEADSSLIRGKGNDRGRKIN